MAGNDPAFLDENQFLGTSFNVLFLFIFSGAIVALLVGLLFMRREGIESLTFKLILHLLFLFIPISWIGNSSPLTMFVALPESKIYAGFKISPPPKTDRRVVVGSRAARSQAPAGWRHTAQSVRSPVCRCPAGA